MKKKLIISLVIISVVILLLFAGDQNIHFESKSETARGCLTNDETDTAVVCEQITPLVELGHQIEQICREGKRAEIDNYVVSKAISIEEAAVLAEKTPIMSYMKSYAENSFTIPTDGICMIAADVNNDGLEDLIEYGPADCNAMWNWRIANRLVIYLGKSDEETDFMKLCSLNIWAEELVPQSFFVEETPRGNVTYVVYQDINEFAQQIEGCLIKDGTYEKVVSLRYTPIMEFSLQYEFKEKGVENRITYVICHAEDNKSVSLKWKENNGSEDKINQNIQSIIEKKLADIDWEENRFLSLGYYPIKATDEIFIFDYVIYYEVPWETVWDEKHTEIFSMEVNLVTGECREIGSEKRETMSKEGCQQW